MIFWQRVSTEDGSGGYDISYALLLSTRAIKEPITRRLNDFASLQNDAGEQNLYDSCFFVIRKRPDFVPQKDQSIVVDGQNYTMRAVIDVDTPQNYWRLFCIKSDLQVELTPITTPVLPQGFVSPITLPVIPAGTAIPLHIDMAQYAQYGKNPTFLIQIEQDGQLIPYSDIEIRKNYTDLTFTTLDSIDVYGHGTTNFTEDTYLTIKV
jgi:hypothetical protein